MHIIRTHTRTHISVPARRCELGKALFERAMMLEDQPEV
jgi:hypothetical protein